MKNTANTMRLTTEGARLGPSASLLLAAAALAVWALPGAEMFLQFDRRAIGAGEWHRWMTGHWTHWSADHFLWDAAAFGLLGVTCECFSRFKAITAIGVSAFAISLAVWIAYPWMTIYRGLSGIDSALFALLAAEVLRRKLRARSWGWVALVGTLFIGFLAKVTFEMTTGAAFFVDTGGAWAPVPLAHLVGAGVGLAIGFARWPRFRRGGRFCERSAVNIQSFKELEQ